MSPTPSKARDENSYQTLVQTCLMVLAISAVTVGLIEMRTILVPFVLSLFAFAAIRPLIGIFENKLKLPHGFAIAMSFLSFLSLVSIIVIFIVQSLEGFIGGASIYQSRVTQAIEVITGYATHFGLDLNLSELTRELRNLPMFDWARKITGGAFSFIGNSTLIFIFLLFLLFGTGKRTESNPILEELNSRISTYVNAKLLLSLMTGGLVWIVFLIFGVELAFMFGILTVLLNFIPNVGSLIATLLPVPILLLQFGLGWQLWVVLILCFAIQFSIGNLLEPKLMGDSMDLHPVTVLLFLMFWGWVWGIAGMFLAVPITAILRMIFANIPITSSLAELMAGRIPNRV